MMPNSNDILLNVLKGHLLIEEKLDLFLNWYFADPKFTKRINLTFKKLVLVQSLCQNRLGVGNWWDEYLWDACSKLNKARNEFAHNLETEKHESVVGDLLKVHARLRKIHVSAFQSQTGKAMAVIPFCSEIPATAKIRALIFNSLAQLDDLRIALDFLNRELNENLSQNMAAIAEIWEIVIRRAAGSAKKKKSPKNGIEVFKTCLTDTVSLRKQP